MIDYERQLQQRSLSAQHAPGKQIVIVPFHVIKYVLREGGGDTVKPGMTLSCLVQIYTSDGTQISNSRDGRITRYLVGRGRLIDGLEVGLKGAKKDEKFRLAVSPDYGYAEDEEIPFVPPETRLIFEIQVLGMERVPLQKMSDTELYYEVYYFINEAEEHLRNRNEWAGIKSLFSGLVYGKKIKNNRCSIVGKIYLKLGNIYCHQKKFKEALTVIQGADKYQNAAEDYVRTYVRIYERMGRGDELQDIIERFYHENLYESSVRRLCVEYFKEIQCWEKLKRLQGYDYKKDRLYEIKPETVDRGYSMRMFF